MSDVRPALVKFFRTPKGLLIVALTVLIPLAGSTSGFGVIAPGVAAAALGPVGAVVFGGVGAILITGMWARLFPELKNARTFEPQYRGSNP